MQFSCKLAQRGTFFRTPVDGALFIHCAFIVVGACGRVLNEPTPLVLAYYTSLVVGDCPGVGVVLHIAAIELVTMALVWCLHAAERGVIGFQCYDHWISEGGSRVLIRL